MRDQTIAADVSCIRCAYNLRGLGSEGKCPECGAPIKDSLSPERLIFRDPTWLATIVRGQGILLVSVPAVALVFAGATAAAWWELWTGVYGTATAIARIVIGVSVVLGAAAVAVCARLSTWPQPRGEGGTPARLLAWMGAMVWLGLVWQRHGLVLLGRRGLPDAFYEPALLIALLALCEGLLLYWVRMAQHIPDGRLVSQSRRTIALLPIAIAVTCVLSVAHLPTAPAAKGFALLIMLLVWVELWRLTLAYHGAFRYARRNCVRRDTLFSEPDTPGPGIAVSS